METKKLTNNIILYSDSYKYTHWMQIPKGTSKMGAYIESRGTKLPVDYTRPFGMQAFLQGYLEGKVLTSEMIDEAAELLGEIFGTHEYFNEKGFRRMLEKYDGYLPVRIKTVKEGAKLQLHNVMVWIESTDEEFAWIVPWLETMLLRAAWYGTAVCTISSMVKDIEREFMKICGCSENIFFLNDFGARAATSHESAEIAGGAHLVMYSGTDTTEGVRWAKHHYGKVAKGYSVFASEHSTTTIWLREGEENAYTHMLNVAPKDKVVSLVLDSYNYENAVRNIIGKKLKPLIMERTAPTVVRPDSGNPVEVSLNTLEWLWECFGGTYNEKGYKVLDPHVRIIYGDGINIFSIREILQHIVDNGFSIENIIFGMGGKLHQDVCRDTFQNACKLCWAIVDGEEREIYKDPNEDSSKKSKRGYLKLIKVNGEYVTVKVNEYPEYQDELIEVFYNGKMMKVWNFDEVRAHARE